MGSIQTAHVAYFSGTGGTARVAGSIEEALNRHGISVRKTELLKNASTKHTEDLLVLLFPVYALLGPKPVDDWVARIPNGEGRPAAVISVSAGGEISPNTNCRSSIIRLLTKKDYDVRYECMFVMPCNFLFEYDDSVMAMLLRAAPQKAERTVSDILSENRRRTRPHIADRVISRIGLLEKRHSGFFGSRLYATDACTGCGWCAAHCPVGNISLQNGKPLFGENCVICLRCVYECPKKAIMPGACPRFVLKNGYDIAALESRFSGQQEFPPLSKTARGPWMAGVRKYLQEEYRSVEDQSINPPE